MEGGVWEMVNELHRDTSRVVGGKGDDDVGFRFLDVCSDCLV